MTRPVDIHLTVVTPTHIVTDERVRKVIAEATNGSFALLPRHVDFVAPLTAGILAFEPVSGGERFLGIDEGFLVKAGERVRVATHHALSESSLERLQERVHEEFEVHTAHALAARSALDRLETSLIRRFVEMERLT
ncbi:hypothetical protein [Henriciella aquimarina]|uniref:hypothetical protein n=1 Tax=Henriciella aquimarina TaxID=545261 RepID=UPI000A054437|nr:hypothetical protein [Henriciella aquimarina]